ncbi:diaminopimelate epimerase [Fonticella tunisiensis]|uniref:Diaminopimelate epimerase n=1 Tax=Fonticella tunisiensis TaxID=1096341 RepID=A0A4R7KQZ3_9CLOT|nr:diaminopimelate epimerase [Fonticella tunisiensis]TDT61650.1 diaminopimelate epimerase [Fonticella tunisiensis]
MHFAKLHGLGNDFILIENLDSDIEDLSEIAIKGCDRHFGVGADGLLVVEKSKIADIKMTIINSDGSVAEMCGNGIRCFAKYIYEKGIVKKDSISVETLAGIMKIKLKVEGGIVSGVKANMGSPSFEKALIPFKGEVDNRSYFIEVNGKNYSASTLLMGVPHTILYVDDVDDDEIIRVGREIENMSIFPSKTNVNFVKIIDRNNIKLKTWERGAGLTLACGTGTCASVVASYINGLTENKVRAKLQGGYMYIDYDGENVFMEGPAEFICEGELLL